MAIEELNSMVQSDEFKSADSTMQKQALRGFFKTNVSTDPEFIKADQATRDQSYRGFLNTYMPKKGFISRAVDAVVDKAHSINEAIREDTSIYNNKSKPITANEKYKLAQNSPRSPEYMANLKAAAEAETLKAKMPEPITADEKLKLAKNQADMGRRSPEYIQKLETDAAEERKIRPDIKATYDWDNSSLGHKIQTAVGDAPVRVIKSVARDTLGMVLPKTAEELFGHDEFEKAHPDVAMAQEVIGSLPIGGMGLAKVGKIAELGEAIATAKAVKSGNKIFDAAQEIIDSSSAQLGINIPKAQAPEVLAKDEAIANALNHEYPAAPKVEAQNPHPQASTRPADFVADMNVAHKVEEVIDPKIAEAKAAQEERVAKAHEEAMARKAQIEAEAAHKADVEGITANPRLQELIDMRRDVTAKESANPNVRDADRQIIHENNGYGYETTVIPAQDSKNWNHDFALTKADIKAYEKNGMTPELAEKFKKDLEVLDNDPMWQKVDENPPADFPVDKDGNPLDADGNQLFVRGADNLLAGTIAGVGEDENGNITFDPEMFVVGLGGYTAVKAILKNPTVQNELKDYSVRALNELDKKEYARFLTGEMPFGKIVPATVKSEGGFYSVAKEAIDKMPNRMNVAAFRNYLKGRGVKNDEMVYGQIEKALEGKEIITKEEMIGAFANPVLEKKVLGEVKSPLVKEYDDLYELIAENPDKYPKGSVEYTRWEELSKQLTPEQIGKEYDDSTKYKNYALKDVGENYREELAKLRTDNQLKTEELSKRYDELDRQLENAEYGTDEYNRLKAERSTINDEIQAIPYDNNNLYSSSHWDDKNVLYHARKQDTTINGEKTLLIEELQSDWHQDGRKIGYQADGNLESAQKWFDIDNEVWNKLDPEDKQSYYDEMLGSKEYQKKAVPQAPYSKNWHEKALKDQIDEAVQKGYARVAWVDGKTSADRYSLSQSVDRLVYNKNLNVIQGYKDGSEVMYKSAPEGELESMIGKEPAKRLMENEVHSGIHEIKGEALDIGGDGMKGFYDKILPDYARKYVKKWGAEVTKEKLPDGTEVWSFPVTKEMSEEVSTKGQALYAQGGGAVAGVGEDENGNLTFDPLMAIAGAVGVSAVMSKSVRNALSKVAAKSESLSDSAMRNVVVAAIKGADKITAGSITKIANTIKDSSIVDYVIGHKIYRLKDYMKLREDALRGANAGMEQAARLHLQLSELSSEGREAMYAYMSGEKNVALSHELKTAADTFITKIDDMGQKMVDEGFLTKEAYDEWKGQYLHRRYASKIKQAGDWFAGKGEFAVDKVQMRGKQWKGSSDEFDDLEASGMIGKVSEGKVEAVQAADGSYHFRRDWTKEERTGMGEIRDVAYSLPETMGRLAQMIEFGKMLKAVPTKYILDQGARSDVVMKGLGYEKLTGSRYGALNGKWVNGSIAGDLKRVSNDVMGEEGNVKRLWNDYISAVKMTHTIYNPTAHVNNIGSNVFLQAAAGLNPLKTVQYATQGTLASRSYGQWKVLDAKRVSGLSADESAQLAKLEADADVQLWKSLDERKMFGRSQLNEILRSYMSPHIDTTTGSMIHKTSEAAKALYQGEDDVMRFAAVKQLMKDGLWTEGQNGITQKMMTIDEAMKHANDHIIPDYSKPMSKLALTLRDSGVVPFMSWTYYSTPILLSQLKNNPTRVMAIAAAWYGLDRLMGVDPYDDETMPKGFDAQRVAISRDGNKVTGMRVSSMIPHIQLAQPENTYLEPLTSGIPQTMLGAATNYNFYFRKPITTKEGGEGTYHRVTDFWQNVLPSPDIIDKAYNLGESKILDKNTRRRDRVIEPRTTAQEAASFFVNLQTYDVAKQREQVRKEKIKDKKRDDKWEKKVDKAINKLEKVFQ